MVSVLVAPPARDRGHKISHGLQDMIAVRAYETFPHSPARMPVP